jgi:DNA-directed RNA polymerase specialized sigma24 family protein
VVWQSVADELLRTRYSALVAHAAFLAGAREGAEDLVHEAFVSTFSRIRPFPNAFAAEGYVRRAIATKYLDRERNRARENSVATRAWSDGAAPPADDGVGTPGAVDDVLAGLTPRERACVALRYIDQYSTAETAKALGISEGAVKRYVADGVHKIAARYGAEDDAGPDWATVHVSGGKR